MKKYFYFFVCISMILLQACASNMSESASEYPASEMPATAEAPAEEAPAAVDTASPQEEPAMAAPPEETATQGTPPPRPNPTPALAIPKSFPRFPMPPPKPSTTDNLPTSFINACKTVGEVDKKLSAALSDCGYLRKSYFYVPNGFAMVTQFESINADGSPKQGTERWVASGALKNNFTINEYFKRLLFAKKGFYRTIVFILSDDFLTNNGKEATSSEAKKWLETGANKLPKAVAALTLNNEYSLDALIYEFKKSENDAEAILLDPSPITGRTHLTKTNIIQKLR